MRITEINEYGLKGYRLPNEVYRRARWLVSDYPRIKAEYESMITDTPEKDGQPGGSGPGDPTARIAARRESLGRDVDAVEKAFARIPKEYAGEIFKHLTTRSQYPAWGDPHTWYRHQRKVLYLVAVIRGY